jgi:hypothetical protein
MVRRKTVDLVQAGSNPVRHPNGTVVELEYTPDLESGAHWA